MIGQTISHYRILEKLGEGGMGIVYKAQDTKLDRLVALKFLPDRVQRDESAKARFIQEARSAAGLNHPNICTVHGVEDVEGSLFIVMEYVEGGELGGKIPFTKTEEAIKVAAQIGEALQEAHAKGIVHRDIKADNIMLSAKGQAKVMDFGLAKLKGALKLTRTSSTVGTLGYMAPEQVQGEEADTRSDIFSFGVLLYEMLTGKLPFRGEHEAAMVYSIVNEEPQDITSLKPDLSPFVVNLINRCLEKDPDDRYQTMQDAVSELRRSLKKTSRVSRKSRSGAQLPTDDLAPADRAEGTTIRPTARSPLLIPFISAVVMIAGLSVVIAMLLSESDAQEGLIGPNTRIYRFTSMPGLEDNPSWSPDGKFIAYETDEKGQTDIIIQPADGGSPVRVLDSEASEVQATWSPDGSLLAFVSSRDHGGHFAPLLRFGNLNLILDGKGGDIFVVKPFGGEPLKLISDAFDPAWSPDGKEIAFRSARDAQWDLWKVPSSGGEPTRITNDAGYDYQPAWSPDGKWIVFGSTTGATDYGLYAVAPNGGQRTRLTADSLLVSGPEFVENGAAIIYSSARGGAINLWQIPFTPESDTYASARRFTAGHGDDVNASVSRDQKKVAYAAVSSGPDVWELTIASGRLRRVTFENGVEQQAVPSPDGSQLALRSDRGSSSAIWIVDLQGSFKRLFSLSPAIGFPFWSPNGKQISYNAGSGIEVRNVGDLSSTTTISNAIFSSWDPTGTKIAFIRNSEGTDGIWTHEVRTGKQEKIALVEGIGSFPAWSADGRMIAFNEDVGDIRRLLVVPASGGTPRVIPTDDAEYSHAAWSPVNNDQIVCVRDHLDLVLVSISTGKVTYLKKFEDPAIRLTDYPSWSRDGKKVYFDQVRRQGDIFVMEK
ncbi:MAG: protein kinase [Bacteroidota bacterium]